MSGAMLGRRDLLRGAGALGAIGLAGAAAARPRRGRSLGLADITVSKELARDYAGTLRQVAAMGYTHFGFKIAGYTPAITERDPREKAQMVRDAGLAVGAVRFSVIGADYDRQIADAVAVGATEVVMSAGAPFLASRPVGTATRAAFDAWLPQLAALGAKCRAAGLTFAYHNHWWDLLPLGGEAPLDVMARTIPPSDLAFEVDLAWAWWAGVAPLDLIARLGPRVASMHFKDIDRTRGKGTTDHAVVIGSGEMGYAALLPRLRRLTSAIGYVEVDAPPDGLVAAAEGARFFHAHR